VNFYTSIFLLHICIKIRAKFIELRQVFLELAVR